MPDEGSTDSLTVEGVGDFLERGEAMRLEADSKAAQKNRWTVRRVFMAECFGRSFTMCLAMERVVHAFVMNIVKKKGNSKKMR